MILDKVVWLCVSPRVGHNAVLSSLRAVIPGAAEGLPRAEPADGILVFSSHRPVEVPAAKEVVLVQISRFDKVAQAISFVAAIHSGRFHSVDLAKREPTYVRRSVQRFLDDFERSARNWDSFLGDKPRLKLVYEDDIEHDPREAAQRILDYAGIEGVAGPPALERFDGDLKARWRLRWDEGG